MAQASTNTRGTGAVTAESLKAQRDAQDAAYRAANPLWANAPTAPTVPAPQKGQTDFSQWAAAQAAQGPRQDAAYQATQDARRAREDAQWLPEGFERHEEGYSKVIGGGMPAAGIGSGAPAGDVGGAPSGGAGDGLSASMASLTGAAPAAGQALQEPGGSLLRPTLVTRHPAVMSASLAQLRKAY